MTNINGHYIAIENFDVDAHAVAPGYFDDRIAHFEQQFRNEFPQGWPEFYAAYSIGNVERTNLDYDEWAFLCEHFLRKLTETWQPPGACVGSPEKPEIDSGFSIGGGCLWLNRPLTPFDILTSCKRRSTRALPAMK
jgi:hypothetical protein